MQNALYNNYCIAQLTAVSLSHMFTGFPFPSLTPFSFSSVLAGNQNSVFTFICCTPARRFLLFLLSTLSPPSFHFSSASLLFSALTSFPLFFSLIPLLPLKILSLLIFLRIFISFESFSCLAKIAFSYFHSSFRIFRVRAQVLRGVAASLLPYNFPLFQPIQFYVSCVLVRVACPSRVFFIFGFFLCLCRRRRRGRLLLSSDFSTIRNIKHFVYFPTLF